jgi:hypothetical protein
MIIGDDDIDLLIFFIHKRLREFEERRFPDAILYRDLILS